jgi:hypothetical protein
MTEYYDIVLWLIPLSFVGLAAVLLSAGLSLSVAVPLASVATVGLICHALFVNAPVTSTTGDDKRPTEAAKSGATAD